MLVLCRSNSEAELSRPWAVGFADGTTDLTPGKRYIVYAVEPSGDGVPGYILCGDRYSYYPLHYPAELFEIADRQPSRHWVVGFWPAREIPGCSRRVVGPRIVLGFPEWVADWGFHYRVTEGREPELSTWQRYKQLLDAEAGITERAVAGNVEGNL
jgi:hypothetical protein